MQCYCKRRRQALCCLRCRAQMPGCVKRSLALGILNWMIFWGEILCSLMCRVCLIYCLVKLYL